MTKNKSEKKHVTAEAAKPAVSEKKALRDEMMWGARKLDLELAPKSGTIEAPHPVVTKWLRELMEVLP